VSGQFDAFHSLETEKKERIIDAALDEITKKGFKKASTNAIVEQAGISKGMLFYYFGNKEELFDFICEYTIEFAKREYIEKFAGLLETRDFIERCKALAELKRRIIQNHPKIIKFYESFFLSENAEQFSKYSDTIQETYVAVRDVLYNNIDYTLFRDVIEPEKTLTYIRWLTERYEKELTDRIIVDGGLQSESEDNAFNQYYEFLTDLKKIFYVNGGE